MYKYVIFFLIFITSCEKTNYVQSNGALDVNLCSGEKINQSMISVLSMNVLQGSSIHSVSQVLENIDPDIIGLQESYDLGIQLADRFDYCFYGDPQQSTAVLSKYDIEFVSDMQYKIILNDSTFVNFFNVHLPVFPYQPYDIRDTLITTELQAIHQAEQTRGLYTSQLASLITKIDNNMPIILVGDFNEPSHLDWIYGAENPFAFQYNSDNSHFTVDWPASNKILNAGLLDSYRVLYPDPVTKPGYTWSTNSNIDEVHDRTDFIYFNDIIDIYSFFIIGPDQISDIIVNDYESDHRGVFGQFHFSDTNISFGHSPCEMCGSSSCCLEIHTVNCCCYPR